MIPERVRTWVTAHAVGEVSSLERLGGGLTDTIWGVRRRGAEPLVLRYVAIATWGEAGRRHVECEALGCVLMLDSGLPTPRLIASDPDGSRTGAYANLSTWLPGSVRLGAPGPLEIDELARVAAAIHARPVDPRRRPPAYVFWAPSDLHVPPWARRPDLWRRAIEIFADGPPPTPHGLVHRDFHPGNILWSGDRISGVIDWAETSWGPPDLDVAHAGTNFAILHDLGTAAAFTQAYVRHGGVLERDPEAARFWALSDILGFLPDPAPIVAALISTRPELTADVVRQRLEQLLGLTLGAD
ncbi:MAG TPA: aminoglycoside phosphotransferase family protein [Propionibacteriaceae bacterium]